ncbi:MAG: HEAT repeat domain-containing protein [Pirellulales bacterium]|nr:HEAT repeat domain-containing protein [Pirellulales bacterium]
MLDQALEALKTYDWGVDVAVLTPIEEAAVATHADPSARADLETKLAALLDDELSRDAKDYVCRKLMAIGTAASVAALAPLLANPESSHMARYALERIPAPEAGQALRDALAQVDGELKVGMIGSLAKRPADESLSALTPLVNDDDPAVAKAAITALGRLRTPEAAQALAQAKPADEQAQLAAIDARLACAESLLAAGKKTEAMALYKPLMAADQPKHVRLAATRGLLASSGKKVD